jgi:hypothetical protein
LENPNFWRIEASFLKKKKNYLTDKERIIHRKIIGMKFAIITIKRSMMSPMIYHILYIVFYTPNYTKKGGDNRRER